MEDSDGLPIRCAKSFVEPVGQLKRLLRIGCVLRDRLPRGDEEREETHLAVELRVAFQQLPVRLEAAEYVLARVEAVDADDDLLIAADADRAAVVLHLG